MSAQKISEKLNQIIHKFYKQFIYVHKRFLFTLLNNVHHFLKDFCTTHLI